MSAENIISHQGIIQKIENNKAIVNIVSNSSCASCSAKSACNASEQEVKIVEVQLPIQHSYQPNDNVEVAIKSSSGSLAVLIAYIFPLVILLSVLIISSYFIDNQGFVAILGLFSLVPYYLLISLLKLSINRKFDFFLKT